MRQDIVVAMRREYHARRSAQEKAAADTAPTLDIAQRHLALHRLHEIACIEMCCVGRAEQTFALPTPAVKSAPHRVIVESPAERIIELSPEQAIAVAELIFQKAAEARGDGMMTDEMSTRNRTKFATPDDA